MENNQEERTAKTLNKKSVENKHRLSPGAACVVLKRMYRPFPSAIV
jgi:hypothetical protein